MSFHSRNSYMRPERLAFAAGKTARETICIESIGGRLYGYGGVKTCETLLNGGYVSLLSRKMLRLAPSAAEAIFTNR